MSDTPTQAAARQDWPQPYGHIFDGDPNGLRFSREPLTLVQSLMCSSEPVYAYSQLIAYGDARAAAAIAQQAQELDALRKELAAQKERAEWDRLARKENPHA